VAVGVLDMALWDAVSKAEGVPLWRLLADRYNGGVTDKTPGSMPPAAIIIPTRTSARCKTR